jgi:thiamine pyrophosphokinase
MKSAAVITGGYNKHSFLEEELNNVKYDYIVGVDSGCNVLFAINVMPDAIIGDFDSIEESVLDFYKNHECEQIFFDTEKDFTDTELALKHLNTKGISQVTIYGAMGTRMDHSLANIALLETYSDEMDILIKDSYNRIRLINGPYSGVIRKDEYEYFSLIPVSEEVMIDNCSLVKYPLSKTILRRKGSLGVSNQWISDKAVLEISKGTLLIICAKD